MQTILGASGQIGHELAIYLKRDFATDIRLVSRNPKQVNGSDQFHRADLPGLHPGRASRPEQGLGGQGRDRRRTVSHRQCSQRGPRG